MHTIEDIIKDYMASHTRLTVVGLGTFLSKGDGGQLLFTEFVVEDDGVLFDALVVSGVGELLAAEMVETFVRDICERLDAGESCSLAGIGELQKTPVGIRFTHQSVVEERVVEVVEERVEEPTVVERATVEKKQEEKREISGAAKYQDFVAGGDEPKRRPVDILMVAAVVIALFAVILFGYSLVIKWQVGELVLSDELDAIMMKLFGSL